MKNYKISNKGTKKLFDNKLLERLTRTHFLIPVLLYYFLSVAFLAFAYFKIDVTFWKVIYLFPIGMIMFSFVEYLIHRYIFHFNAETEKEEELKYHIHGVHHEFPRDKDRLVMPPVMSILIAVVFYFIFSLVFNEYVWLIFPGFLSGYSTYLVIHYSVHRFRPPDNFLKYLWKHHSLHHYKSEETAFSVSFPVWDILFGTMPDTIKSPADKQMEEKLPDYK
jgi:4-hydroxysphinganine ceramide fatty acyl 2-hydroxylase